MKFRIIILLLAVLTQIGCEDFFDTTLELEAPPFEKNIIVNSVTSNDENRILFHIGQNIGILEKNSSSLDLIDATVELNINNQIYTATVATNLFSNYNYYIDLDKTLTIDDSLQIIVSHPNFKSVTSSQIVFPPSNIKSAIYAENGGLDNEGNKRSKVTVSFIDPPGKNFYAIEILAPDFRGESNSTFIESIDPSVSDSHEYYTLLIEDSSFDGKEKQIDFQMYQLPEDRAKDEIKVLWYNISEDFYKYSKSLISNSNNQDNPFATPVPVHSNIKDGAGIFAIHTRQIIPVN